MLERFRHKRPHKSLKNLYLHGSKKSETKRNDILLSLFMTISDIKPKKSTNLACSIYCDFFCNSTIIDLQQHSAFCITLLFPDTFMHLTSQG